MAENLAITFDNWIITPPDGIIARQYDNLSRDLVVTGTFPDGYLWEMLIWCKGNYNTLAMTQSEGQLSTTLTDEDLAFDGYYKMQLRGTIGEEVRHTNVICVKIPCSIDGDVNWPEIPSIYREYLQQVQQLVQNAQDYAGNAETDANAATQAAQTATGAATQAQGYAQTAETASTDAQDAASTAQSAESDAQQHADNAQASADQAAQSAAETADKIPLSQKGAAGGVATLDDNSLVPTAQLPVQPISKGGTGATTAAQARTNLGAVGTDSPALVQQYTHAKSGVTHNLTGPAGAKVIQFVATANYVSGNLVAVNGITLKATDLRGLPLPDKTFVTGSDVIALVPNSASGGSITFQVLTPASNPNLLDNWYFVGGGSQQGGGQFPINQRGQTRYTGGGYGIDRWKTVGNATVTLNTAGISYTAISSSNLRQIVGNSNLDGLTLTASGLYKSITSGYLYSIVIKNSQGAEIARTSNVDSAGIAKITFQVPSGSGNISFEINSQMGGTFEILGAKLELGPVQTLAHQDADGNWVLNDPPPNFQQELAKCQRYQLVLRTFSGNYMCVGDGKAANANNCFVFIPIPVSLRALPAISYSGNLVLFSQGAVSGSSTTVTALTNPMVSSNGITLSCASSGLIAGESYQLWGTIAETQVVFDANL